MFNKYYDFQLIKYQDRPILILFGLMKKMEENLKEITSIKFYNESQFIENKGQPYKVQRKIED